MRTKKTVAAAVAAPIAAVHSVGRETDATVSRLLPLLLTLATADADASEVRESRKGTYSTMTAVAASVTEEVWKAAAADLDRRQTCNVDGLATKAGLAANTKEKGKYKLCRSWTAAKYVLTKAHEFRIPMLKDAKPISFGKIRQEVLAKVAEIEAAKLDGAAKVKADILAKLAKLPSAVESLHETRLDAALLAITELHESLLAMIAADAAPTAAALEAAA